MWWDINKKTAAHIHTYTKKHVMKWIFKDWVSQYIHFIGYLDLNHFCLEHQHFRKFHIIMTWLKDWVHKLPHSLPSDARTGQFHTLVKFAYTPNMNNMQPLARVNVKSPSSQHIYNHIWAFWLKRSPPLPIIYDWYLLQRYTTAVLVGECELYFASLQQA